MDCGKALATNGFAGHVNFRFLIYKTEQISLGVFFGKFLIHVLKQSSNQHALKFFTYI